MGRQPTPDRHRQPGGFTLIELLVVISIISVMMSLLLPSLNRARKQGEQIHCLTNQHQLYLAWLLYIGDSDDRLCSPSKYHGTLDHYTQSREVFLCKTAEDELARDSYAVSNIMGGTERDGVKPYARFHTIAQAGEKMVLVDRQAGGDQCFWPLVWSRNTWVWRPWSWPPGLQGMTARHGNGCNMTFADGHGEAVHWKDERTLKLIRGTFADEQTGLRPESRPGLSGPGPGGEPGCYGQQGASRPLPRTEETLTYGTADARHTALRDATLAGAAPDRRRAAPYAPLDQ